MRTGHLCLDLVFVAIAATAGGCAVDDAADDQTSEQDVAAKPAATAYVLTVSALESVRVTGGGQTNFCDGGPCNYAYLGGTALTLQAIGSVADCYKFSAWSGACAGQPATCNIVINSTESASAAFARIPGCRPQ